MIVLRPAICLALCLMASPVFSESIAEAVKTFGLIGTWSIDCARDREVIRMTFSSTVFGAVKRTEVGFGANGAVAWTREYDVTSAVRAAEDKIKLTSTAVGSKNAEGDSLPLPDSQVGVYEKIGNNKIRVIDNRVFNGKVIYAQSGFYCNQVNNESICEDQNRPTIPAERCLN